MINRILFLACFAHYYGVHGEIGPCEIALEGGHGRCMALYDCKPLLSIVRKKNKVFEEKSLLKRSLCGIEDNEPAVCCPIENGQCYTPEGKLGQCISLYSCPDVLNLLKPKLSEEVLRFVQNSKCDGTNPYNVCCGPIPIFNSVIKGKCVLSSYPPEPESGCCGVDNSFKNKIYGGTATTIDQYPWLGMIEYNKNGTITVSQTVTLISGKYVVTRAIIGEIFFGKPVNIRLGEYDTDNEGPDCVAVEGGGMDCTDGAISIPIERIIRHPMYNGRQKTNNIALIRMTRTAPYTDFIRPICLPALDVTQGTDPIQFIAAGWGTTSFGELQSNTKMHVDLPYVNLSQCQSQYSRPGRNVSLGKGHICAGGVKDKDTCKGDGTLMYKNGNKYEYIGFSSFGVIPCGIQDIPSVYTYTYTYISWIKDTIVP